jgi:hypothetical protein
VDEDEIEDLIHQWHNANTLKPIWEFMGWTYDEYKVWVETGESPE